MLSKSARRTSPFPGSSAKSDDYIANGAKIAWLILPEDQCVFVLTPNAPMLTALAGETLDGGELLPELEIPVEDLFS